VRGVVGRSLSSPSSSSSCNWNLGARSLLVLTIVMRLLPQLGWMRRERRRSRRVQSGGVLVDNDDSGR